MNNYYDVKYADYISWTLLDNEVFVFNEVDDSISLLRGIQKEFWLLLEKDTKLTEIISVLSAKYDMELKEIERKTVCKLEGLLKIYIQGEHTL